MKKVSDIVTIMYEILNVPAVTDLLDDGLFRFKRDEEKRGKAVVLVPLPQEKDFVSEGVLNVNIHAPTLSDNSVDEDTLNEITDNVVEVIEAYESTDSYMVFEITGQGMVTDDRDDNFVNLRVNYYCEHKHNTY